MALNEGKSSVSCANLADKDVQSIDIVTQVEEEDGMSPPSEVVVEEEEESGVEKMSSPPPPFPLSESKNGVALDDMWPSLPPRSGMQGMLPPSSLPMSGGGWMELFVNDKENPTALLPVGLAPSSSLQRRRTQPAKPLLIPKMVNTPSPPPVLIEEVKLTPSPALVPIRIEDEEEEEEELSQQPLEQQFPKVKDQQKKPKEIVPPTFQNPFSLLADTDMADPKPQPVSDKEKVDPPSQPPPVEKKSRSIRKVKFQTPFSDKEKVVRNISNPRKWSKSLDKGNQNMSSSFFIAALLCIVPFLLVVLTSLKIGVYFY